MPFSMREGAADDILEVAVSGKLTRADYADLVPTVEHLIEEQGKIRVLLRMQDFHGWTAGALWDEIKLDVKHLRHIQRIAILGEKAWQRGLTAFFAPFTKATVRYFAADQTEAANAWLVEEETAPADTETPDPGNVPPEIAALLHGLASPSVATCTQARAALAGMGMAALPHLVRAARGVNHHLRWEATKTLAEMKDPVAAPALARQLEDSFSISWAAAEGLTHLGQAGAEAVLQQLLESSNSYNTRIGARHALSNIRDLGVRQRMKPVVTALDDAAPIQQAPVAAIEALRMIRGHGASAADTEGSAQS